MSADTTTLTHEHPKFDGGKVNIISAPEEHLLNVLPLIRKPKEFYGDPNVHHLVDFGGMHKPLIGLWSEHKHGAWPANAPEKLVDQGIVVMERFYLEAKRIMEEVAVMAGALFATPSLYDSSEFCEEYMALAREGYDFQRAHLPDFGIAADGIVPVSLERAGLVSTRLGLGVDQDAVLPNEIRVVTKRVHLNDQPEDHLAATVKWRDFAQMEKVNGQPILQYDFVNPASGASTAALLLAARSRGVVPSAVHHRSISLTRQGTLYMQRSLAAMGIGSTFVSLGEASELTPNYYLTGNRGVGDAGHALRHFLPAWYQQ